MPTVVDRAPLHHARDYFKKRSSSLSLRSLFLPLLLTNATARLATLLSLRSGRQWMCSFKPESNFRFFGCDIIRFSIHSDELIPLAQYTIGLYPIIASKGRRAAKLTQNKAASVALVVSYRNIFFSTLPGADSHPQCYEYLIKLDSEV